MVIECSNCGATNSFQATACTQCGQSFKEEVEQALAVAELGVKNHPDIAASWHIYALALLRRRQVNKALDALDKSLPLFEDYSWSDYLFAATLYDKAGRADFAQGLLADGIIYHLDNYREMLDPGEIEDAGNRLHAIFASDRVQADKRGDVITVMNKNTTSVLTEGLGTYAFAQRLANPKKVRLYPKSTAMIRASKFRAQKRMVIRAVIAVFILTIFACTLSILFL